MEFVATKRRRKWRKKRYLRKRMHDISEVRSSKHTRVFSEYINIFNARKTMGTMCADAFWKNYAASQEWQKRHNITWWRSRCIALEYENEVLRNKLRSLTQQHNYHNTTTIQDNNYHEGDNGERAEEVESHSNAEELEFNMTEDMLKFFETSERHRKELQEKRQYFKKREMPQKEDEEISVVGGAEIMRTKKKEAQLLYGNDGPKILAMETAMQATLERYKDLVNPQYWPNVALKP